MYNSPSSSLNCLKILVESCSWILATRFWRKVKIERRPRSTNFTSSETSSPTSKSGSIFWASLNSISWLGSSTSPSATTIRLRQISKSPLSGLMMMSKLSSEPNLRFKVLRKTSSKMTISVTRSMSFSSLNSENESINAKFSITKCLNRYDYFGVFIHAVLKFFCFGNGYFSFTNRFGLSSLPLQGKRFIVCFCQGALNKFVFLVKYF